MLGVDAEVLESFGCKNERDHMSSHTRWHCAPKQSRHIMALGIADMGKYSDASKD